MQVANDDEPAPAMYGVNVSANGHGLRCIDQRTAYWAALKALDRGAKPLERLAVVPPAGLTSDQVSRLASRFDEGQLRVLADFPPRVGGLFPNWWLRDDA